MNEHKSQAELLDLYLEALAHDPQASVPPGLDEKMAAFARQLMDVERVDAPVLAIQQRVWGKMMVAAQKPSPSVSSNGRTHSSLRPLNMEDMMNNTSVFASAPGIDRPLNRRHVNFSLAVAALIVVLFAAVILFAVVSRRGEDSYGAEHIQASSTERPLRQTATAQAALPSPTPLPPYLMTGTAIIQAATETAIIGNATATAQAALPPHLMTGTAIIQAATETAIIGNVTATAQAMMANATSQPSSVGPTDFTLPPYQSALIPVEAGMSVEGTVTGDEPAYYYLIQGRAGDLLTVTVNASDLVSMGYALQYVPQVGADLNTGGGGGGGGGGPAGEPVIQTAIIPLSANAAIIFAVQNEADGQPVTYTLELAKVEIPRLIYGETFTDSYNQQRPGFPYIYYDFVGQRGDIVDIVVESELMDGVLALRRLGEDGQLTYDDDSGAGVNPEIEGFQLPADGTYRVEVYPINLEGLLEAEFHITVSKHDPIALVPGERQQLFLSDKYAARVLSFEGQADQAVELTIEYNESATLVNFSIEQNGNVLDQLVAYPAAVGAATSDGMPQRLVSQITIPADGTIKIFVNADASTVNHDTLAGYPIFVDMFDVVVRNH